MFLIGHKWLRIPMSMGMYRGGVCVREEGRGKEREREKWGERNRDRK